MRRIKKGVFDICAGDCATCVKRGIKNLSLLTIAVKKKLVTKYVPPDMGAIKLALEIDSMTVKDITEMSDTELLAYERELERELGVEKVDKSTTEDE